MKVTNTHNAILNVAGTDIRPGATVDISEDKLKKWSNGAAAKRWLEVGLITIDDLAEDDAATDPGPADKPVKELTAREKLMEEAKALGLNPNANTSNDNLKKMIEEAKAD